MRYEFEKAFYEERNNGELSVSRLKELMVETQRRVLGGVLQPGGEDPYFWASKLHFYITGLTFYNFPYTFGLSAEPRSLRHVQERRCRLSAQGMKSFSVSPAATRQKMWSNEPSDADLENPDFWSEAIKSLEEPLKHLETLLPKVLPSKGS